MLTGDPSAPGYLLYEAEFLREESGGHKESFEGHRVMENDETANRSWT